MGEFEEYLEQLADRQEAKSKAWKDDARHRILVHAGVGLNWIGDFLGNSKIKWEKISLPISQIQMTGTEPEWNELFIEKCARDPLKLLELLKADAALHDTVSRWAGSSKSADLPILVRRDGDKFKVLDGMHRFVAQVLAGLQAVEVWAPVSEELPICESHVVYDLIRGYIRNARDKRGKEELYCALKLLNRTYSNVGDLLKNRFNEKWVPDNDVQEVIRRVLTEE